MTTKQVLELDCRIEENREAIQKVLRQIKPLAKCPDGRQIPIDKLERCLKVLCNNYGFFVRNVYPDTKSGDKEIIWRSTTIDEKTLGEIGNAYGCTFYECIAKTVILLYSVTRKRSK